MSYPLRFRSSGTPRSNSSRACSRSSRHFSTSLLRRAYSLRSSVWSLELKVISASSSASAAFWYLSSSSDDVANPTILTESLCHHTDGGALWRRARTAARIPSFTTTTSRFALIAAHPVSSLTISSRNVRQKTSKLPVKPKPHRQMNPWNKKRGPVAGPVNARRMAAMASIA
jgi:hypothetical protein